MVRVAVVDRNYCKPDKCSLECIRFCPVNRGRRKKAIELSGDNKYVVISEDACIGCGICVKKCPFHAISIVNLPDELEKTLVHRYGENMFKLYNLPAPRTGSILGVVGRNGAGKSTSIKILAGQLKPNLGNYSSPPDWDTVIKYFRGTELQAYFTKLASGEVKAVVKPQYIEAARRILKGTVRELMVRADERGLWREVVDELNLSHLLERRVDELSGGELQKFLVAAVLVKNGNAYFFDEPCSYLDIRERIRVANVIREFSDYARNYVVVVEHDLMVLDYMSDNIVVVYGEPGVYGVVSKPYGTRTGINHYLKGYLPAENMRIREDELRFRIQVQERKTETGAYPVLKWDAMVFQYESSGFRLTVEPGDAYTGEVLGILGPNGVGKTTFLKLLNREAEPLEGAVLISAEKISVKPQELSPRVFSEETVMANLKSASPATLDPSSWIYHELVRKLGLNRMLERRVDELSGGELQKLAVAVALARDADLYFLDEPSAYLDVEERISVAKTIRRIVEEKGKTALVVEHDLLVQNYISDRVMVFLGKPGVEGHAHSPVSLREGFNRLLRELDITVRRDSESGRPRINKPGSVMDREQKARGEYYLPD
ncbi:ribosome biogenesis/translation initiation ATPase RLI [Desulfurococcus mucosus]|uniref:ABC transporter related protein n=1 Tax=Desulfurococcus mucosus (strain ATCC 35584 / DSM 2162 / JCM 9187 / O7/1) TaxID=765177 RepID=E8R771_DESM0|nr:ribosome biogenesis/translation initiation ATPase RLI [Desulfurococcus mucosus]ADV65536.1 ABC transporter related protein [Desulfurococcus mucosus DSM 2162]